VHREAIDELTEAIKLSPTKGTASDFLFLALAHQQLGQAGEAKKWFDRAAQAGDKPSPQDTWGQRLQWQLLRREAEQAFGVRDETPGRN
jgi:hypothetical protein